MSVLPGVLPPAGPAVTTKTETGVLPSLEIVPVQVTDLLCTVDVLPNAHECGWPLLKLPVGAPTATATPQHPTTSTAMARDEPAHKAPPFQPGWSPLRGGRTPGSERPS